MSAAREWQQWLSDQYAYAREEALGPERSPSTCLACWHAAHAGDRCPDVTAGVPCACGQQTRGGEGS